jgi:hypothetical protein
MVILVYHIGFSGSVDCDTQRLSKARHLWQFDFPIEIPRVLGGGVRLKEKKKRK